MRDHFFSDRSTVLTQRQESKACMGKRGNGATQSHIIFRGSTTEQGERYEYISMEDPTTYYFQYPPLSLAETGAALSSRDYELKGVG